METNVNYAAVGGFVIILIAAIVLSIIYLSSGFSIKQYKTYLVYMQESVSGLSYDSAVEFNGVNVGNVKYIEINNQNPQLVKVLLSISNSAPITKGTVATLNTRGITGVTYVALKDQGNDLEPLKKLPGQRYPVIPNAPSLFVRLDTALSEITRNVREVSSSIRSLLDQENQASFKKILVNLREITGTLSSNSKQVDAILKNTARASKELPLFLQSSKAAMQTIELQTLPSAYQALTNINETTRTLSEVATELKQNPSILIRGRDEQSWGPGE